MSAAITILPTINNHGGSVAIKPLSPCATYLIAAVGSAAAPKLKAHHAGVTPAARSHGWRRELNSQHQTQTLGREAISGSACDETQAFEVHFATPPATFNTGFTPSAAAGRSGSWSYAYAIARAGESHKAQGTYTLMTDVVTHVLHVKMTGSDHVAFKGFDGNMPIDYQFDLVPAPGTPCSLPH